MTSSRHSQPGFIFEETDAVIRLIITRRRHNLRHVSRTHRVDLDWQFVRINLDRSVMEVSHAVFDIHQPSRLNVDRSLSESSGSALSRDVEGGPRENKLEYS